MAYDYSQQSGGQAGGSDPYAFQRNQASQRSAGQQQSNYDALQRRFANNGGMNSGAAIQAEANADRGTQQDLENTQGAISQEQGQNDIGQQQKQTLMNQQQAFQGQQAGLSREQQAQEFGVSSGLEQQKVSNQASQFSQELPLKQKQLDLEASQMGMDAEAMNFNEQLASYQQQHSGGLLGAGGLLGTGLGAGLGGGGNGGFMGLGIG